MSPTQPPSPICSLDGIPTFRESPAPPLVAENLELRICLEQLLERLCQSAAACTPLELDKPFVERCYRATGLHRRV